MPNTSPRIPQRDQITSLFWSGDAIRSRSVSDTVLSSTVNVVAPSARLMADWQREISLRLALAPGDVESLPLARARTRWPDYKLCVQAMRDWTSHVGLGDVLATSDVALMACRGARYHHDGAQYGGSAFCNLFLSEDQGLDLHFPATNLRIPITRGTAVVFDTGQPHAVIKRNSSGFNVADFPANRDCTQIFLTWELPIENVNVASTLAIAFDTDTSHALSPCEEQLWRNGERVSVCPDSGQWQV